VTLQNTIDAIKTPDQSLNADAQAKIDGKTKPLGSLGVLESVAVQMCAIQNTLMPEIARRSLCVFAADHGIARAGVSAYPAEVTAQMVLNFLAGGAAINVFCRQHNIGLHIADMGVDADFNAQSGLINQKIRRGSANFLEEPAMSTAEARATFEAGATVFEQIWDKERPAIFAVGDMGIGNTTASAAIIAAVTGQIAREVTGRGTGIDDDGLAKKIACIEKALAKHQIDTTDAAEILHKVGGLEIGGIAGAILAAAAKGIPVVLDGVIATAGALIAHTANPKVVHYLFAGHRSVEIGHRAALDHLGLHPLLDLDLRLGEGTGAALAISIIDSACRIMCEMASFTEAGVSESDQ
jgi:nicotinate-nucleotide--dimethylbenzimidazole phosphoribosyltransferase